MNSTLNKFYNEEILLTGSSGYIGNQLKIFLNKNNISTKCSVGDLSNKEIWRKNLDQKIDTIFHLAATEGKNKDISMNSNSVLSLLEVCVEKNIKPKIIYASSTNVFGLTNKRVVNENTKSSPLSEYSTQKFLGENYLKQFNIKYDIPSITLRLPNVYGPSSMKKNFNKSVINRVIRESLKKKDLKLFNNRNCFRDFLYIDDVVNAFYLCGILDNKYFNANSYLFSSNEKTTINDIWRIILRKTNNKNLIIDDKYILSPMEYRDFNVDSSKYRKLTSWRNLVKIDKGIKLTIDYLT